MNGLDIDMEQWTGVFIGTDLIAIFRYEDQAVKWANAPGNYKGRAKFKKISSSAARLNATYNEQLSLLRININKMFDDVIKP